jgi:hypothetical protein
VNSLCESPDGRIFSEGSEQISLAESAREHPAFSQAALFSRIQIFAVSAIK